MTGYLVHYSDGDTDRNESVLASSTSSLITGLTNCITYNFSVEATSEHLSGESDILTIELGSLIKVNPFSILLYRFLSFSYDGRRRGCESNGHLSEVEYCKSLQ